jgi:preprotein translocase subunit SecA
MNSLEQWVMLHAVNDRWMDHLQMVDYIREGIGLRGYGQVDPLIAYKRETFDLFQNTLRLIRDQAVRMIYHANVTVEREPVHTPQMQRIDGEAPAQADGAPQSPASALTSVPNGAPAHVDWRKVGRNEPCPCGSGKKFKACHYPKLRAEGVI